MPVGFQSWGANNSFIQIDSNYRQLRLTQQGRALTNQLWGTGFISPVTTGIYSYVTVRITGDYPIVAIRCGTTTAVMTKAWGNAQWDYTFIALGGANTPIDYWVFNEKVPDFSNVGIQIFKGGGDGSNSDADLRNRIVFDGNDKPARIMHFTTLGALGSGAANYQEELIRDFGRGNWAVCQTAFPTNTVYETGGQKRALLNSVGAITRGNQLLRCRSISAMYDPAFIGQYGSSSYYAMGYLTVDLDSI